MLSNSLFLILILACAFTIQVSGSFMDLVRGADDGNQQQYHRSLDAAEDCVTATIDLVDPLDDVSGLWFFPNYLALNFGVCNITTAICDYNNTDYDEQSLADCNAVGGKIVKKNVRICLSDVAKISNAPAFADLDFINVAFCFAQSCDESIPMVQFHRALYFKAEREKAPGTENPYATLEASSKGLCLTSTETFPPSPAPTPAPAPASEGSGIQLKLLWIGFILATLI